MSCAEGNCPKCGGNFSGPRYDNTFGREQLIYICRTCGYRDERPTKDSERDDLHPFAPRRSSRVRS